MEVTIAGIIVSGAVVLAIIIAVEKVDGIA